MGWSTSGAEPSAREGCAPVKSRCRKDDPEATWSTTDVGLGLGLPLCRTIVEAHGGTIRAEPRPGGGAVFVIQLPLVDG